MSIGILVLLSVGSVLIVNWIADRRIVREYTSRLITRGLSAEERSLRPSPPAAFNSASLRSQSLLVELWQRSHRFTGGCDRP